MDGKDIVAEPAAERTSRAATANKPGAARVKANRGWFYFSMSLLTAAIVVYGFGYTIDDNLIHPAYPRPSILYLHALVFSAWVGLFILQTGLIRAQRVAFHRRVGLVMASMGALIPVLGVATAIAMAKLRLQHGEPDAAGALPISSFDMVAFTACFAAGIYWRRKAGFHRRLMFMATSALAAAAFGRIPLLDHADWFYLGVDALIAIAVIRDWKVDGRVHPVYLYGLPLMMAGQVAVASFRWSPWWVATARNLF